MHLLIISLLPVIKNYLDGLAIITFSKKYYYSKMAVLKRQEENSY